MRVRTLLPASIRSAPLVLNPRGCGRERSIFLDWQRGDASSAVIGGENILAGIVDPHVAIATALAGFFIERLERAIWLDGECADRSPARLDCGVEELFVRMNGKERRILRVASQPRDLCLPYRGIEHAPIDPLAAAGFRV